MNTITSEKTIAGIVTFNPDMQILESSINTIISQVARVIIVDNDSMNFNSIADIAKKRTNIIIIKNEYNKGIAAALNQIGQYAYDNQFDAFLTLDQDSISDPNLISKMLPWLNDDSVAFTCPVKNCFNDFISSDTISNVTITFSSGCLIKTDIWKKVGGFWEYLFIDEVDHEFCYLLRKNGYKMLQINSTFIEHTVGTPTYVSFFGIRLELLNHNAFRKYYIARNDIIMAFTYPEERIPYVHRYLRIMELVAKTIIGENDKLSKLRAITRGTVDGLLWGIKYKGIITKRMN